MMTAVAIGAGLLLLAWVGERTSRPTPIHEALSAPSKIGAEKPTASAPALISAPTPRANEPVYLNTATESDLRRLPGVGPKRAQSILALRAKQGRFRRIEDLLKVHGIGRTTLARLRPLVELDPPAMDAGAD